MIPLRRDNGGGRGGRGVRTRPPLWCCYLTALRRFKATALRPARAAPSTMVDRPAKRYTPPMSNPVSASSLVEVGVLLFAGTTGVVVGFGCSVTGGVVGVTGSSSQSDSTVASASVSHENESLTM